MEFCNHCGAIKHRDPETQIVTTQHALSCAVIERDRIKEPMKKRIKVTKTREEAT